MARWRSVVLLAGTWLLGVAVAIGIGYYAIGQVGSDLNNRTVVPVSDAELRQAAASSEPTPEIDEPASRTSPARPPVTTTTPVAAPPPSSTTTPPATSTAQSRRFTTEGGVASASCTGSTIMLLYAYPNDGYTSVISRDPSHIAIAFRSPTRTVHLNLRCVKGIPVQGEDEREPESGR